VFLMFAHFPISTYSEDFLFVKLLDQFHLEVIQTVADSKNGLTLFHLTHVHSLKEWYEKIKLMFVSGLGTIKTFSRKKLI